MRIFGNSVKTLRVAIGHNKGRVAVHRQVVVEVSSSERESCTQVAARLPTVPKDGMPNVQRRLTLCSVAKRG